MDSVDRMMVNIFFAICATLVVITAALFFHPSSVEQCAKACGADRFQKWTNAYSGPDGRIVPTTCDCVVRH